MKKAKPCGAWEVHDWDGVCEETGMCSKMYEAEDYEALYEKAVRLEQEVKMLQKTAEEK